MVQRKYIKENKEFEIKILAQEKLIMLTPDGFEKRKELAELTILQAYYIKHLKNQLKL